MCPQMVPPSQQQMSIDNGTVAGALCGSQREQIKGHATMLRSAAGVNALSAQLELSSTRLAHEEHSERTEERPQGKGDERGVEGV